MIQDAGATGAQGLKGDTGDTGAQGISGDDIPAQTLLYVANILVNSKAARLEITLDADFLASTALDIVFRHPYTLNTNFHATSQTADVQVQWVTECRYRRWYHRDAYEPVQLGSSNNSVRSTCEHFITMRDKMDTWFIPAVTSVVTIFGMSVAVASSMKKLISRVESWTKVIY
jgi:hypothetical protein